MDQGNPTIPETIDFGKSPLQKLDFQPAPMDDPELVQMDASYHTGEEQVFQISASYSAKDQLNEYIHDLLANMEVQFNVTKLETPPSVEFAAMEPRDIQRELARPEEGSVLFSFAMDQPDAGPGTYRVAFNIKNTIAVHSFITPSQPSRYQFGWSSMRGGTALSINVSVTCNNGTQITASVDPGATSTNPQDIAVNATKPLNASSTTPTVFTVDLTGAAGNEGFTMSGSYTHV
jgi:hypothetical protein